MQIVIHNTDKIVELVTHDGSRVAARVWEGHTESGIPIHCMITRIAVHEDHDQAQFQARAKGDASAVRGSRRDPNEDDPVIKFTADSTTVMERRNFLLTLAGTAAAGAVAGAAGVEARCRTIRVTIQQLVKVDWIATLSDTGLAWTSTWKYDYSASVGMPERDWCFLVCYDLRRRALVHHAHARDLVAQLRWALDFA